MVIALYHDRGLRQSDLPNIPVWHDESCAPTTRLGVASDPFSKRNVVVFKLLDGLLLNRC